jgi:hypothetical protein
MTPRELPTDSVTAARFSIHDLGLVAGLIKRRLGRIIDETTPVGAYVRELERSVASLEDELHDWRRRHAIAVDERRRCECRMADVEHALDAATMALRRQRIAS